MPRNSQETENMILFKENDQKMFLIYCVLMTSDIGTERRYDPGGKDNQIYGGTFPQNVQTNSETSLPSQ